MCESICQFVLTAPTLTVSWLSILVCALWLPMLTSLSLLSLIGTVLSCEKRENRGTSLAGRGVRDVGRELAARVSVSPGLVHSRQGPPALPPLLSAGSAAAETQLNKALFICADCIHCTSRPLGCGTTQICPALQRKGRQTCSQQQSA